MSPLWFMAFISLGVLAGWLLMVAIVVLSETRTIRRLNGWAEVDHGSRRWSDRLAREAADLYRDDPMAGGSLTWTGERR